MTITKEKESTTDIEQMMVSIGKSARKAAADLATVSEAARNQALQAARQKGSAALFPLGCVLVRLSGPAHRRRPTPCQPEKSLAPPLTRFFEHTLAVACIRLPRRLVGKCSRWKGLVWSYTVFLSPGSSRRTAAESHEHLNFLEHSGQRITTPRPGTEGTTGFTEVRISQIHLCFGLPG